MTSNVGQWGGKSAHTSKSRCVSSHLLFKIVSAQKWSWQYWWNLCVIFLITMTLHKTSFPYRECNMNPSKRWGWLVTEWLVSSCCGSWERVERTRVSSQAWSKQLLTYEERWQQVGVEPYWSESKNWKCSPCIHQHLLFQHPVRQVRWFQHPAASESVAPHPDTFSIEQAYQHLVERLQWHSWLQRVAWSMASSDPLLLNTRRVCRHSGRVGFNWRSSGIGLRVRVQSKRGESSVNWARSSSKDHVGTAALNRNKTCRDIPSTAVGTCTLSKLNEWCNAHVW